MLAKGTLTDTTLDPSLLLGTGVGGIYEKELTSGDERLYLLFGWQRIAMEQEGTLHHLVGDHPSASLPSTALRAGRTGLGTTSVVLSSAGALGAESRHYPYGEERCSSGAVLTDYRFAGQLLESDLSICLMEARWSAPYATPPHGFLHSLQTAT